jgi:hypothetical protein
MQTITKYAICADCNKPMLPGNGCKNEIILINGTVYKRIPYDQKKPCHDCNVIAGQYHHIGCDMEICPKCKHQLISCNCNMDADIFTYEL